MRNFVIAGSIIAIKDKNSTIIAADKNLSYGRLAKAKTNRINILNNTVIAISGEFSDSQHLINFLKKEELKEDLQFKTHEYFKMIQRYLYHKRSNLEPLNIKVVVGGFNFLGLVDQLGNFYESDCVATGLAHHIVLPLLRESEYEPIIRIRSALEILNKRECSASNDVQIAIINENEINVLEEKIVVDWKNGLMNEELVYE